MARGLSCRSYLTDAQFGPVEVTTLRPSSQACTCTRDAMTRRPSWRRGTFLSWSHAALRTDAGKAGEPVQFYAVRIFRGMFSHIKGHIIGPFVA